MGRVLAGEDTLEVLAGAWAAAETFGWEIRRLGVLGADFRPLVFDGLFLQLPINSVDALRCAYATVLIREANYSQADELLSSAGTPSDPFDADMACYVSGLLHFRTQRWTDVLRLFPVDKRWYRAEYECAATAMATTALASLGVFEDAFRRGERAAGDDRVPQAATVTSTPRRCAFATWAARTRPLSCCAGCIRVTRNSPRPARRWTTRAGAWC